MNRSNPAQPKHTLLLVHYITRSVQKVLDLNFFCLNKSSTGSVLHCGCGGDIYAHAWISFRLQIASVAGSRSMIVYVLWALSGLSIIAKWRNELSSVIALKFCQKLGDTQVETIRKIQQAFGDDAMSITRIKRVVQLLQRWRHISGQRTTSR